MTSLTLTHSKHKLPNGSRRADRLASSCTLLVEARFTYILPRRCRHCCQGCTAFNETGLRASPSNMVPPPIRTKFEPSKCKVSASSSQGWLRPFQSWLGLGKSKGGSQQEPAMSEEGCEELVSRINC